MIWLDATPLALAPLIDRYAFLAALAVAAIGWFAFRRSLAALAICLAALVASIIAGFVRAEFFAEDAPLHVLLSAAGEIALIGCCRSMWLDWADGSGARPCFGGLGQ